MILARLARLGLLVLPDGVKLLLSYPFSNEIYDLPFPNPICISILEPVVTSFLIIELILNSMNVIQVGVNVACSSKKGILCVSLSGWQRAAGSARLVYSV